MTLATFTTQAETEWTAATQIQERFMQHSQPTVDGLLYSATCRQVYAVGGDFYDFMPVAEGRLAIAIGDASGKGLPAALMVSNVQSSLRTASILAGDNIAAVLGAVNRQVYESSFSSHYATLFYGIFDRASRVLRYVNAGHHAPIIIRRNGSVVSLAGGGAPIGLFPHWNYQEESVELFPGDCLLAYTDGIVEAENAVGEPWGIDRLEAVASRPSHSPQALVDSVFDAFDNFTQGAQTDDATVAVFKILY